MHSWFSEGSERTLRPVLGGLLHQELGHLTKEVSSSWPQARLPQWPWATAGREACLSSGRELMNQISIPYKNQVSSDQILQSTHSVGFNQNDEAL